MLIEISAPVFDRLKKHAVPLVDTPASVIERLLNHFESGSAISPKISPPIAGGPENFNKKFNPLKPPELFHTRCQGLFGSKAFSNWNDLVRIAHIEALGKAKSFEKLKTVTHAQIKVGNHSDAGFHFVREIGVSIQGVDANHAWKHGLRLAMYLNISIKAQIEWRNTEKAAHPGVSGVLEWNPS